MLPNFGKLLILFGSIMIIFGLLLLLGDRIPYIGRLPGDIYIRKGNFSFYFPLMTCIILSIIFSLIFTIIRR